MLAESNSQSTLMLKTLQSRTLLLPFLLMGSLSVMAQTFAPIPALSFTKPFSGADPLPQNLTVASVGGVLQYGVDWSTASGGNWLSVSGCTSFCDTPTTLVANVKADSTLAPGPYTGQIIVSSGSKTLTIMVTL